MISDRISFFKTVNLPSETYSKYKNVEFSEDEAAQLEELLKIYKLEEHFNFAIL
ncbi:hypothetical protein KVI06_002503, partial [Listeria monocytogenes]|nr:hypothetical protein [Listeria monocytogenes]